MSFLVTDTVTNQDFPANDVGDAQEAIWYILDGQDLSDLEYEEYDAMLVELGEDDFDWSHSSTLGIRVVRNG